VRWSDGAPFTVEDVLFTLNDVLLNEEIQEGLGFEPPFRPQVTRLDRHRVEFALEGPLADQLLIQAAELPILPRHRLAEAVRSPAAFAGAWGLGTPADQIVGLGPFRLKEVRKTGIPYISERVAAIVFERNPYYWKVDEAGTQLPYLDRFTRIFVQDDAEALRALKAGEIDLLAVRSSKEAAQLAREPQVELVVDGPIIGVSFLAFHQDVEDPHLRGLFRDVRFRRAVAYATDRAGILAGVPERAPFLISRESFVHPLSPFFSEEATVRYPFDLAQAVQLLDDMGLRDRDGDGMREFPDGSPIAFELLILISLVNDVRMG
jgi:peptide/nickel transport system substrate-binding protein